MKALITYEDLLPFAKTKDWMLHIDESFEIQKASGELKCMVISVLSCYVGKEAPTVQFQLFVEGQEKALYTSHIYSVGKPEEYTCQSWRVPPMFLPNIRMIMRVTIPEGTTWKVCNFSSAYDTPSNKWDGGLRFNAHLGFLHLAPSNTMPAFEMAAFCGFPCCIVCPKVTKDGVFVCIHDYTINLTARDKDGNQPEEPIHVMKSTYEELSQYEYGSFENEIYRGAKLPLLEDFFKLCAKTGMHPMFSAHYNFSVEQWLQIKDMLKRYNLLKVFHLKCAQWEILQRTFSIFGTEIDGYTFDAMAIFGWDGEVDSLIKGMIACGIDNKKCRAGIELQFDDYTPEKAKKIIDAGFFASAYNILGRTSDEYRKIISYGVTEFTEDKHCSMGLDW